MRFVHLIVFSLVLGGVNLAFANVPQQVGVVGAANPAVQAVGDAGVARPLKTGDPVYLNDKVITDVGGTAQLMFLDKSSLTITPNSAVTIDTFVFDPATSTGSMTMQGAKGALRFIGGALSKRNAVKIKTPVATIGIRGGIADVHVEEKTGATESIFLYGVEMQVENKNGDSSIVTHMGNGFSVANATAAPQALDAGVVAQRISGFQQGMVVGGNQSADTSEAKAIEGKVDLKSGDAGKEGHDGDHAADKPDDKNGKPADKGPDGGGKNHPDGDKSDDKSGDKSGDKPNGKTGDAKPGDHKPGDGAANTSPNGKPTDNTSSVMPGDKPAADQNGNSQTAANAPAGQKPPVNPGAVPPQNGGPNGPAVGFVPGAAPANPPAGGMAFAPLQPLMPPVVGVGGLPPVNNLNSTASQNTSTSMLPPVPSTDRGLFTMRNATGGIKQGGAQLTRSADGAKLYGPLQVNLPAQEAALQAGAELPATAGYTTNVKASIGGVPMTGNAYLSAGRAMAFYDLSSDANAADKMRMVVGHPIEAANLAAAASATVGNTSVTHDGLTFYNFLPDTGFARGNAGYGFFDHAVVDNALLPVGANTPASNAFGVAVDWSNKVYLGGEVNWMGHGPDVPGVRMAAGNLTLNPVAGGNVMAGGLFNFQAAQSTATPYAILGDSRVRGDIYGNPGGGIDGFLLEGAFPSAAGVSGDLFSQPGEQIRQSAMASNVNLTSTQTVTLEQRTGNTNNGFMAGYIISANSGANPVKNVYMNSSASDVTLTKDLASGRAGATVRLSGTGANTNVVQAQFGATAGTNSAFVRDSLYALQQGNMNYNGTSTALNATNAVLITGSNLDTNTVVCSTCQFVHWGVWAGNIQKTATSVDVANMLPYVAGEMTKNVNIPTNITGVTYNGGLLGVKQDANGLLSNQTGSFSANLNLANRQITSFNGGIDGKNFGFSGQNYSLVATNGTAAFANLPVSGTAGSGVINGALFGPQGQNMGGNFAVSGTNAGYTGVYMGTR